MKTLGLKIYEDNAFNLEKSLPKLEIKFPACNTGVLSFVLNNSYQLLDIIIY